MSTAAETRALMSEAEYLAAEVNAPTKHEYVAGLVYAMAGGRVAHNAIASNALISLGAQLRGKPCRPFNSAMKVVSSSGGGDRSWW